MLNLLTELQIGILRYCNKTDYKNTKLISKHFKQITQITQLQNAYNAICETIENVGKLDSYEQLIILDNTFIRTNKLAEALPKLDNNPITPEKFTLLKKTILQKTSAALMLFKESPLSKPDHSSEKTVSEEGFDPDAYEQKYAHYHAHKSSYEKRSKELNHKDMINKEQIAQFYSVSRLKF